MLKIVFLDRASLPVAIRPPVLPHHWIEFDATSPEEVVSRCAEADVVISNKVVLNAAAIAALPQLKLVAIAATGVNNVDLSAALARDIAVCNIRGYADATVPEHALALMLALLRNLPAYQRDMAVGKWQQSPHFCHFGAPIRDLNGRTLLIIGAGSLGQGTAKLARAFGMQVLFAEHKGAKAVRDGYVDFQTGLEQADIVSLHCPLTAETKGLISTAELAWMKHDAVLINTARGGIIDEVALLAALQAGKLGGAGIDVLHEEPPSQGNPLLEANLPNLIITPHVGWASFEAMSQLAEQLIGNIEAWAEGTPRNLL
ncbi:D-2-hydroxyacid dehydrogenase [Chitinimonas sp. PSY-7]|uniref:NAD(P)-dependent oxidoreductase n=1 Tax=Chitinimonas sp. PSY-7 TaxID=3459088 RepID=UPI004040063A